MDKLLVKYSKFLALILRHKPDVIDLKLDQNGWANIDEVISKSKSKGFNISKKDIVDIVENNNKKRYSISTDGKMIRAEQGHSLKNIVIDHDEMEPPEKLFHGTATSNINLIYASGIKKMSRQHVHMSEDMETAEIVAKRHSNKIVIFKIDSEKMFEDGFIFYRSKNGVWLTDNIPSEYISIEGYGDE